MIAGMFLVLSFLLNLHMSVYQLQQLQGPGKQKARYMHPNPAIFSHLEDYYLETQVTFLI